MNVPHACLSRIPSTASCSSEIIVYLLSPLPDYEFFVLHPGVVLFIGSAQKGLRKEWARTAVGSG